MINVSIDIDIDHMITDWQPQQKFINKMTSITNKSVTSIIYNKHNKKDHLNDIVAQGWVRCLHCHGDVYLSEHGSGGLGRDRWRWWSSKYHDNHDHDDHKNNILNHCERCYYCQHSKHGHGHQDCSKCQVPCSSKRWWRSRWQWSNMQCVLYILWIKSGWAT